MNDSSYTEDDVRLVGDGIGDRGIARAALGILANASRLRPAVDHEPLHPGDEARCHRCHGPNTPWSAPSPLWNEVMRGGSINGDEIYDGIVCSTCFAVMAEERGIAQFWRLTAERVHVPLETVTPSGRTWDTAAFRWQEPVTSSPTTKSELENR